MTYQAVRAFARRFTSHRWMHATPVRSRYRTRGCPGATAADDKGIS